MAMQSARLAAFMWMYDTIRSWGRHAIKNPSSSVVFQIGPCGDEDTRLPVARMMMYFSIHGHGAAHGRISFDQMNTSALIVTVNPPLLAPWGDSMINAPEAWWRQRLLRHFWIPVVRLERRYHLDTGNAVWSTLWHEVGEDWAQQMMMPGVWENV
jgi:hypothetical protein